MSVNAGIDADDIYIKSILKTFKLVDIRRRYHELIETAIEKNLSYKQFLVSLLDAEKKVNNKGVHKEILKLPISRKYLHWKSMITAFISIRTCKR